ncbi:hypothetical protein [Nocardioides sp.]|uniref:hypothetical protein n=1 Tax=Nocardioides sp. TaxID=35761 RepID=UPI002733F7CC|nr:hypothetical protein [Nocardioides sp.]MDP3894739.1 hypothetical protein [Nocardioides sp.]
MSTSLHVTALVVALLSVPTIAALTAWGLAGGDGSPESPLHGLLGALVALGSAYNAVTCWTAFWGLPDWRWWAMLVAPTAGLVGVILTGSSGETPARDRLVGGGLQLVLAAPAMLLVVAGVATP